MSLAVLEAKADIGIAWDGDFDRCFFFDRRGSFVDGAYLAALIAEEALSDAPGGTVLHDARVIWPMQHAVRSAGGLARLARTGHVHMKRAMAETGAVYGGEMSGHHYFSGFSGCDSGMLPWLKVLSLLTKRRATLDELASRYAHTFPNSGELNYRSIDPQKAISVICNRFANGAKTFDHFDGLSLLFDGWRLNLRPSATEPLLRLNIEALGDRRLLSDRLSCIDSMLRNTAHCVRVT